MAAIIDRMLTDELDRAPPRDRPPRRGYGQRRRPAFHRLPDQRARRALVGALAGLPRADHAPNPCLRPATVSLLPACDRYQLHLTQVIRIRPGRPKPPLHRDRLAWGAASWRRAALNTIWAMTDFTEANGATQVRVGPVRLADDLQARAARGDRVRRNGAWLGAGLFRAVIHAGGEEPHRARPGRHQALTYCLGWLRQSFEPVSPPCPPAIARTLDPKGCRPCWATPWAATPSATSPASGARRRTGGRAASVRPGREGRARMGRGPLRRRLGAPQT